MEINNQIYLYNFCLVNSSSSTPFCLGYLVFIFYFLFFKLCTVKGLQTLATFPGSSMPISKAIYEKVLAMFVSIITRRCEEKLLWKLVFKALMQIGTFIESSHDSEKRISYMNIVIGETVSLLSPDDSEMPLPPKLEALCGIGTTGLDYMMRVIKGLEEAVSANFKKASVCLFS